MKYFNNGRITGTRYSRTPLIRPPPESHWCGRIRGMVAREGFRYAALLQQRHTKYGRMRGMVVGEGGRSTGVLLYRYKAQVLQSSRGYQWRSQRGATGAMPPPQPLVNLFPPINLH